MLSTEDRGFTLHLQTVVMCMCLPVRAQLLSLLLQRLNFSVPLLLQLYFNTNAVCVRDGGHAHTV